MENLQTNPARSKALGFARRGFAVLPIYGIEDGKCACSKAGCSSPGKHPLAALAPHGLTDATTDSEIVSEWFDEYPDANYGVLTDQLPTIDIDPRNGGDTAWRKIVRGNYDPHTWRVRTGGGGEHIICGSTETPTPCGKLARGVDFKGAGGYIVGAGSLHTSGKRYAFFRDCRPKDTVLAPLPVWVSNLLGKPETKLRYTSEELDRLIAPAFEGERNDRVTKLFGHLYGAMRPDRVVLCHLVLAWNMIHCHPPLDNDEVVSIAESICGRERKKREAA